MADLVKLLLRDSANCCALPGMMEQQINCNCLDFHQSVLTLPSAVCEHSPGWLFPQKDVSILYKYIYIHTDT